MKAIDATTLEKTPTLRDQYLAALDKVFTDESLKYLASEKAEALKYITPYAYAEASNIISESEIDTGLVLIGAAVSVVCAVIGFVKYCKKDIAA